MEVSFNYTRDDWAEINTESSRLWLHRLTPLRAEERVGYVFFLILSVLAVTALVSFLAAAPWLGFDWYYLAGAALLLPFPCLMIWAVLWPSAGKTKRGLYHELVFHWKLEGGVLGKLRASHERHLRKLEAAGQLPLTATYTLRLDPEALVWTSAYPAGEVASTTQEDHFPWGNVPAVESAAKLVIFHLADGGILGVPRSAFASTEEEGEFLRAAEACRQAERERVLAPVG